MAFNKKLIFQLPLIALVIIYIFATEPSVNINKFNAVLLLIASLVFVIKARNNRLVMLIAFFILYVNYSFVVGEYLIGGQLAAPMMEVKNTYNYGILIKIFLLFMSIVALFYSDSNSQLAKPKLKDNKYIFWGIVVALAVIFIFGINRGPSETYTTKITPIYEYSIILFLFLYYYSGIHCYRRYVYLGMIVLFIFQDAFLGGRVTSIQLLLLLATTTFAQQLNIKNITFGGVIIVLFAAYIGNYRVGEDSLNIINKMFNSLFVFDTSVYSYYASATHVAAAGLAEVDVRIGSLIAFIEAIILGSNSLSNVTTFVSLEYFRNLGGGIIPSHFYFWMGWPGVLIISLFLVYLFNNIGEKPTNMSYLLSIAIVITTPRWYLYSPISLFRGAIFLTALVYISFYLMDTCTKRQRSQCNTIPSNKRNIPQRKLGIFVAKGKSEIPLAENIVLSRAGEATSITPELVKDAVTMGVEMK